MKEKNGVREGSENIGFKRHGSRILHYVPITRKCNVRVLFAPPRDHCVCAYTTDRFRTSRHQRTQQSMETALRYRVSET